MPKREKGKIIFRLQACIWLTPKKRRRKQNKIKKMSVSLSEQSITEARVNCQSQEGFECLNGELEISITEKTRNEKNK